MIELSAFAASDVSWLKTNELQVLLQQLNILPLGACEIQELRQTLATHLSENHTKPPRHWAITAPACRVRDITMLRKQTAVEATVRVYPEFQKLCDILNERNNKAEQSIIELLRATPRRQCMAIYSFRWYSQRLRLNRENDFLVLDSAGIFVMEVKGCRDSDKVRDAIHIEEGRLQGTAAVTEWIKTGLKAFIEEKHTRRMWWKGGEAKFNMGTAVLLPDRTQTREVVLRVGGASDIAWKDDCKSPKAFTAFIDHFIDNRVDKYPPLTEAQFGVIDDWLSTKTHSTFSYELVAGEATWTIESRWTQGQLLVNSHNHHRFAAIRGFAGTGKTTLAIHRILHLAREHPNATVVIALRMRHLKSFLEGAHPQIAQNRNIHIVVMNAGQINWPATPVDHLIVDEMQRMLQDRVVLTALLNSIATLQARADSSSCWLYFDDNQKHPCFQTTVEGELLARSLWTPFFSLFLNEPVRLTSEIYKAARVLYTGEHETIQPPERGTAVDWMPLPDGCLSNPSSKGEVLTELGKEALAEELPRCLEKLLRGSTLDAMCSQTVILILDIHLRAQLRELIEGFRESYRICEADLAWSRRMVVDSVSNFQGIDRPHVILITVGVTSQHLHMCYIGMTRAISTLIILGQESVLRMLQRGQ